MKSTIKIHQILPLADITQSQQLSLTYDNDTEVTITGELNIEYLTKILSYHDDSHEPITLQIGIDEAGRGPLLGSVAVGAVILPPQLTGRLDLDELDFSLANTDLAQLNDSKKISEKKRNQLYEVIPPTAIGYVTVDVPAKIIDEINILQASLQGMRVAVNTLLKAISDSILKNSERDKGIFDKETLNTETLNKEILPLLAFQILFDGNKIPPFSDTDFNNYNNWSFNANNLTMEAVVKGDSKYSSIASASVMAKVSRDNQMYEMAKQHPQYGIEKHKGYPTKAHLEALQSFGVLEEHRRSFAPVRDCLKN